jgi:hypothetical protein
VDFVDVLELGNEFEVIVQNNFTSNFIDGDSFNYTSIVASQAEVVDADKIPRVIQLNLYGLNAQNQKIVNFFAIAFTNNCFAYPVLMPGNSAGWTQFVSCNMCLSDAYLSNFHY